MPQLRTRVKKQFATMGERRRFWEKLFENDRLAQSLANQDQQAIDDTTEQAAEHAAGSPRRSGAGGSQSGGCRC